MGEEKQPNLSWSCLGLAPARNSDEACAVLYIKHRGSKYSFGVSQQVAKSLGEKLIEMSGNKPESRLLAVEKSE